MLRNRKVDMQTCVRNQDKTLPQRALWWGHNPMPGRKELKSSSGHNLPQSSAPVRFAWRQVSLQLRAEGPWKKGLLSGEMARELGCLAPLSNGKGWYFSFLFCLIWLPEGLGLCFFCGAVEVAAFLFVLLSKGA